MRNERGGRVRPRKRPASEEDGIACPARSEKRLHRFKVRREIASRLTHIFLRDANGEHGAGLGASHQTGWTGLVARMIGLCGRLAPVQDLATGRRGAFVGSAPG